MKVPLQGGRLLTNNIHAAHQFVTEEITAGQEQDTT
jgi:hypothetical protein